MYRFPKPNASHFFIGYITDAEKGQRAPEAVCPHRSRNQRRNASIAPPFVEVAVIAF